MRAVGLVRLEKNLAEKAFLGPGQLGFPRWDRPPWSAKDGCGKVQNVFKITSVYYNYLLKFKNYSLKRELGICILSMPLFRSLLHKVILKPPSHCTKNKRSKQRGKFIVCTHSFLPTLAKNCQSCQIKLYGFVFPLYLYYSILL